MRLTAEALQDFLTLLPHYDALSVAERRALASIERPSKSCSAFVLRDSLKALIGAGFLQAPSNGRCAIEPLRQEFIRTLRLFRGHPVFQTPGQSSFDGYMSGFFTVDERDALRNDAAVSYADRNLVLYRQVTSPDWVQDFLKATGGSWETPFQARGGPALFARPEVLSSAQGVVRWLIAQGGRVILRNLPALAPTRELLTIAVFAAMRYALLFAAIDPNTMEAVLGVWPGVIADLGVTSAEVPPPRNVTPAETFDPLFLVEDMTALLVACATEPLRLRANDGQLFAKTVRDLSATLRPLPKWAEDAFHMDLETRLRTTVSYVRTFQLVREESFPGQMSVSERGREWLALPIGDRLRVLMDGILDRKQSVRAFHDFRGVEISATGSRLYVGTSMKPVPDLQAGILETFRSLPDDGFFPILEIEAFSQTTNPLLLIYRKDKNAYFSSDIMYLHRPDAEQLQKAWSETLRGFVRARLLPLGGVRLGHGKEGVSIAITPAGRYYLGQSKKWEWSVSTDSQIIVQPNFEVTFLGEAPAAEAEIGRFAERRSQRIGALFQITKKSIFAAAAAGMTAESVLEILERVSTRELPGNVRREIQGWFGQCRRVSFESVMLIRCPDRETALRVLGLAKNGVTALTDTVLEFRDDGKQRSGLIKKLKEMGMLVSVQEKSEPPRGKHWGRW
jgi:hypothetical protein